MSSNGVLWIAENAGVLWIGMDGDVTPSYTPHLERAALPRNPDIVEANTPTSVYRLIITWLRGRIYGY